MYALQTTSMQDGAACKQPQAGHYKLCNASCRQHVMISCGVVVAVLWRVVTTIATKRGSDGASESQVARVGG